MSKLCIFGMSTVLSYVFWYGAAALGCDFMWSFLISGVGAIVGCVVGWKIFERYFA